MGALIVGALVIAAAFSASAAELSEGQTVYVPVYSHIYIGAKQRPFDLAICLSIRNTDPARFISLLSVEYYDDNGKLVRKFLDKPKQLGPLATEDFFVSESDTTGGLGAAFLVKWKSPTKVNEPIVEGIMAGTRSNQGISFISRGKVIKDGAD